MRYDAATQSDPLLNRQFRRRWTAPSMTARDIEHLSTLEAARGNMRRAEILSWHAHEIRVATGGNR